MKRKFFYTLVVAAAASLASCSDAGDEHHSSYFFPAGNLGVEMFADQSQAEAVLVSLDTWTATAEGGWFTISPDNARVPAGYQLTQEIKIEASPNTTGMVRTGIIRVQAYSEVATAVRQMPWLDIRRPVQYIEKGEKDSDPLAARCEVVLASSTVTLPLQFTTYAPDATLTCDQPWITVEESTLEAGVHEPVLAVQPNTDTESRNAVLTLTSAGVVAKIKVTQLGKAED